MKSKEIKTTIEDCFSCIHNRICLKIRNEYNKNESTFFILKDIQLDKKMNCQDFRIEKIERFTRESMQNFLIDKIKNMRNTNFLFSLYFFIKTFYEVENEIRREE